MLDVAEVYYALDLMEQHITHPPEEPTVKRKRGPDYLFTLVKDITLSDISGYRQCLGARWPLRTPLQDIFQDFISGDTFVPPVASTHLSHYQTNGQPTTSTFVCPYPTAVSISLPLPVSLSGSSPMAQPKQIPEPMQRRKRKRKRKLDRNQELEPEPEPEPELRGPTWLSSRVLPDPGSHFAKEGLAEEEKEIVIEGLASCQVHIKERFRTLRVPGPVGFYFGQTAPHCMALPVTSTLADFTSFTPPREQAAHVLEPSSLPRTGRFFGEGFRANL